MYRLAQKRDESGFTLIELVVVVAVLGILAAIAIPSFGAIQATAKQNVTNSSAQQIIKELKAVVYDKDYTPDAYSGFPVEWSQVMMDFNNQLQFSSDAATGGLTLDKPGMFAFRKGKCTVVFYLSNQADLDEIRNSGPMMESFHAGTLDGDAQMIWGAAHWDDGQIIPKDGFAENCSDAEAEGWNPGKES